MTKIEKTDIITITITAFLSAFFTWMFSSLTESFDPIIILYTILSTLGVLILFHGIDKMLVKLYEKGAYWLEINRYNNKVNQMVKTFKNILKEKEIYIVSVRELLEYLDPKIKFYKPSLASVEFFDAGARKKSTLDVLNRMVKVGLLIYIESIKLILLKEKMICINCGGEIIFHDKIDNVDIKCHKCDMEYRIGIDGLYNIYNENDQSGFKLYIRTKHLDRLRF